MKIEIALIAGLVALSGCATTGSDIASPGQTRQPGGTVAVAGTIISSMGGGLVGGQMGAGLSAADRRTALEAEYKALEYTPAGQAVKWQGRNAAFSGEVTAAQPYRVGSQDCRQYSHQVTANGQTQSARGTACRNPDGSWTPLT